MISQSQLLSIAMAALMLSSVVAIGVGSVGAQDDPPDLPASYYGEVTIDGDPAPVGTVVEAEVNGTVRGSITVEEAGLYGGPGIGDDKLLIPDEDDIAEGDEVVFYIDAPDIPRQEIDRTEPETIEWGPGTEQQVRLRAFVDDPEIDVEPRDLEFGEVRLSDTESQNVTVTNDGAGPLDIGSLNLAGDGADQYELATDPSGETVAPDENTTIEVSFVPDARSNAPATLEIPSDDPESPLVEVSLNGTGIAPQFEVLTDDPIRFGSVDPTTDETTDETIEIENRGNEPLTIENVALRDGDVFTVTDEPGTIEAGETATVTVRFEPNVGGSFADRLTIATDDPTRERASLRLTGTGSTESFRLSRDAIAFGNVTVGETGERSLSIRNNGTEPLTDVDITTDAPFAVSESGFDLDPGERERIDVNVSITEATLGDVSGTLTVDTNELTEPKSVQLSATGQTPVVNASDSVSFTDTPVNATDTAVVAFENTGNATLSVNLSDGISDTAVFSVRDETVSIEPGETETARLGFTPTSASTFDSNLTATTTDPGNESINVTLSGTGVESDLSASPSTIDFEDVGNGSDAEASVAIENDGESNLTSLTAAFEGEDAESFELQADPPSELAAGESATVTVQFAPESIGERTASLNVTADAAEGDDDDRTRVALAGNSVGPVAVIEDETTDFGFRRVDEETRTNEIVLENDGQADTTLDITDVSIDGPNASAFTVTDQPTSLSGGAEEAIEVAYTPDADGVQRASLVVETNDPDNSEVRAPLRGVGASPDAVASTDSIDAGTVALGDRELVELTLSNDGGVSLNVDSLEAVDDHAVSVVTPTDAFSVAPGGAQTIVLAIEPDATGPIDATLPIDTDDTDGLSVDGTPVTDDEISISATGVAPDISVRQSGSGALTNGETIDIGDTAVGSSGTVTIVVENDGEAPLRLDEATLTGGDAFSIVSGPSGETRIAPGSSERYTIAFGPDSAGDDTTTVTFDGINDPDVETFSVDVSGTGVESSAGIDPSSVSFGDVALDSTQTETLTLENDGDIAFNVTDVDISGSNSGLFETDLDDGAEVAPGETESFTVSVTPTVRGGLSATLDVETDDTDGTTLSASLGARGTAPGIDVDESIGYDDTRVDSAAVEEFVITNDGNAPLNVTDVSISGENASAFELGSDAPEEIDSGDTATVPIVFAPADVDAALDGIDQTATVTVSSEAAGEETTELEGTAITPDLQASDRGISYGEVALGESVNETVTIENTIDATADITIESTEITGLDDDDFTIVSDIEGETLDAGDSAEIEVQFQPSEPVPRFGTLVVLTDDPRESARVISLSNTDTIVEVEFGSVFLNYQNADAGDEPRIDVYDGSDDDGVFDQVDVATEEGGDFDVNLTDVEEADQPETFGFETADGSSIAEDGVDELNVFNTSIDGATLENATIDFRVSKSTLSDAEVDIDDEDDAEDAVVLFHSDDDGDPFEEKDTELVRDEGSQFVYRTTLESFSQNVVGLQQAAFRFDDADATFAPDTEIEQGDRVSVDATVSNDGPRAGTETVELLVDGQVQDDGSQTIDAGGSETFELETDALDSLGDRSLTVRAVDADNETTRTITVVEPEDEEDSSTTRSQSSPAEEDQADVTAIYSIDALTDESIDATLGETVDISASITNDEAVAGSQTVSLVIDGESVATQTVSIGAGETVTVTFEDVDTDGLPIGNVAYEIVTDDDRRSGTLVIEGDGAVFEFGDIEPLTIDVGDRASIDVPLSNLGSAAGTAAVELSIAGEVVATQRVDVDADGEARVEFDELPTDGLSAGEYDVVISAGDASQSTTLTVEGDEPDPAQFAIDSVDPTTVTADAGESFDVAATIVNTGDASDTQDITLTVDGESVATQSVALGGGEETTVTFADVDTTDLTGEVSFSIASADDEQSGTITVADDETTDDAADGVTDDGVPGFGFLTALVALLLTTIAWRIRT